MTPDFRLRTSSAPIIAISVGRLEVEAGSILIVVSPVFCVEEFSCFCGEVLFVGPI